MGVCRSLRRSSCSAGIGLPLGGLSTPASALRLGLARVLGVAATQTSEDRKLTVEVWYPTNGNTKSKKTSYEDETRSGIKFSIQADAFRDSPVYKVENESKFPLVSKGAL